MCAMALAAAECDLYLPIIFMPGSIFVTTEHVWVVVLRPTKYGPDTNAKAGVTNTPTKIAAIAYFVILSLPDAPTPGDHFQVTTARITNSQLLFQYLMAMDSLTAMHGPNWSLKINPGAYFTEQAPGRAHLEITYLGLVAPRVRIGRIKVHESHCGHGCSTGGDQ